MKTYSELVADEQKIKDAAREYEHVLGRKKQLEARLTTLESRIEPLKSSVRSLKKQLAMARDIDPDLVTNSLPFLPCGGQQARLMLPALLENLIIHASRKEEENTTDLAEVKKELISVSARVAAFETEGAPVNG
jgi:phage shock protein A